MPNVRLGRSHPHACYRQGSVCTSAPQSLHSFGNTDYDHTAQTRCSAHCPCTPHSLCHHGLQHRAAHVRQRELAAHTLALLGGVPAHAISADAARRMESSLFLPDQKQAQCASHHQSKSRVRPITLQEPCCVVTRQAFKKLSM